MDKLKGEYDALVRCSAKSTRSHWKKSIEFMTELDGADIGTHLQSSHATEIARHSEWKHLAVWANWNFSLDKIIL